ncbi:hypothetical protein BDV11DRAFT_172968 [Aspergillus similis]
MNPFLLTTQVSAPAHGQDARDQVNVHVQAHVPVHARIPAPAVQVAVQFQVPAHGDQGDQGGPAQILVREEGGEGQEGRAQILVRDDGEEEGQEDWAVYVRVDWEGGLRAVLRRLDFRIPTVRWARLSRPVGEGLAADRGDRGGRGCVCDGHGGGAHDDDAAQEAHEDRDRGVLVVRLAVEQGDVLGGGGGGRISPLSRDESNC